jgi:hypothetical protein
MRDQYLGRAIRPACTIQWRRRGRRAPTGPTPSPATGASGRPSCAVFPSSPIVLSIGFKEYIAPSHNWILFYHSDRWMIEIHLVEEFVLWEQEVCRLKFVIMKRHVFLHLQYKKIKKDNTKFSSSILFYISVHIYDQYSTRW